MGIRIISHYSVLFGKVTSTFSKIFETWHSNLLKYIHIDFRKKKHLGNPKIFFNLLGAKVFDT